MIHLSWKIISIVVLIAISASGCGSPFAPSPTPSPTPPGCLIGIWEIKDPETFLRASLPVGSFDPQAMDFVGSVGSVAYRFDTQGILTVEAVEFYGRFDVKEGRDIHLLDIRMSGFASGAYQQDQNQITLTEMRSSDMFFSSVYLNEEMMSDVKADSFVPLFIKPFNNVHFTCSQDTLSLEFVNFSNIKGPLEFKRLR